MDVTFFDSPDDFRRWLEHNHDKEAAAQIGFYKKSAKRPGITYQEALDEALCYGWIDGVRKNIDADSYTIRFSPRKPRSIWSAVNIKRVGELLQLGLMQPAGIKAFETRDEARSKIYSYENAKNNPGFDSVQEAQFRANAKAWDSFQTQAPSYQRAASWWILSAKKEETRQKRLATLISDSEKGKTVPQFTPRKAPVKP